MVVHTEIAIIETHIDGRREATVLVTPPNEASVKVVRVPFIYRYLRETRRGDAPPHFRFGVIENPSQAIEFLKENT